MSTDTFEVTDPRLGNGAATEGPDGVAPGTAARPRTVFDALKARIDARTAPTPEVFDIPGMEGVRVRYRVDPLTDDDKVVEYAMAALDEKQRGGMTARAYQAASILAGCCDAILVDGEETVEADGSTLVTFRSGVLHREHGVDDSAHVARVFYGADAPMLTHADMLLAKVGYTGAAPVPTSGEG